MIVLAGLDYIDIVFTDFVGALEGIVRNGKNCEGIVWSVETETDRVVVEIRYRAVEVLLAVTAGAYQTTLLTYLIQRDLFPSVMKVGLFEVETRSLAHHPSLFMSPIHQAKFLNLSRYSDCWRTTTSLNSRIPINYA